jgi:uncharacterized protein
MRPWALITGAASGIGVEIARKLAEEGYHLILIDQSEMGLEELQQMLLQTHPDFTFLTMTLDLCRENVAAEIHRHLTDRNIYPEVLINNAGFGTLGLFHEIDWEREKRMIRLHVETLTHLTKVFLNDMVSRGSGKVLNVASVAGFQPSPLMAVYNATKAYILSFSEAIANEVQGTGVTVSVLCPGLTRTGFQKTVGVGNPDLTKSDWFSDAANRVARAGIKGMQSGEVIIVPGIFNKFLSNAYRFLPRNVVTGLVRKIQEKNRRFLNGKKPAGKK